MNNEQQSNEDSMPDAGRLAGIDYGTVRIGIAICDPGRSIASPFENYNRRTPEKDNEYFRKLAESEDIVGFVVGLPIHTDGQESQKSIEATEFGKQLSKVTGQPVCFFDERYTSAFAEQILGQGGMTNKKKKKRLDMIAAQIILTAYLESSQSGKGGDAEGRSNLSD